MFFRETRQFRASECTAFLAVSLLMVLIPAGLSAQSAHLDKETLRLGTEGYTVSELGTIHGSESFRKSLLQRGGVEVESVFGPVLLYGDSATLGTAKSRQFKETLRRIVPEVFTDVDAVFSYVPFPETVQSARYGWQIFIKNTRHSHSAGMLSSQRCHAAWMGPPANIFLSLESFLTSCGSKRVSAKQIETELHRVLVHEVAHAIEFRLMGAGFSRRQRWHSEGFASWFETLTPTQQHETLLSAESHTLFEQDWIPVTFKGSREDYARSYILMASLADRGSLNDLLQVYQTMNRQEVPMEHAVQSVLGWSLQRWNAEARLWLAEQSYGKGAY